MYIVMVTERIKMCIGGLGNFSVELLLLQVKLY